MIIGLVAYIVTAAHDSNCLRVPQGYKKHKPKGFNTGNVMIVDQRHQHADNKDVKLKIEMSSTK